MKVRIQWGLIIRYIRSRLVGRGILLKRYGAKGSTSIVRVKGPGPSRYRVYFGEQFVARSTKTLIHFQAFESIMTLSLQVNLSKQNVKFIWISGTECNITEGRRASTQLWILAPWPWAVYLSSLHLSFLTCEREVIIVSTSWGCGEIKCMELITVPVNTAAS